MKSLHDYLVKHLHCKKRCRDSLKDCISTRFSSDYRFLRLSHFARLARVSLKTTPSRPKVVAPAGNSLGGRTASPQQEGQFLAATLLLSLLPRTTRQNERGGESCGG